VIDFERLFNKRNKGDIEVKKFISMENMNESEEKSLVRLKRKWEKNFHFRSHIQTPHDQ